MIPLTNPDPRLRALERAAAQGDVEAGARLLSERVRLGEIDRNHLFLAASLGDHAAALASNYEQTPYGTMTWVLAARQLADRGPAELRLRLAMAIARELVERAWEPFSHLTARVDPVHGSVGSWPRMWIDRLPTVDSVGLMTFESEASSGWLEDVVPVARPVQAVARDFNRLFFFLFRIAREERSRLPWRAGSSSTLSHFMNHAAGMEQALASASLPGFEDGIRTDIRGRARDEFVPWLLVRRDVRGNPPRSIDERLRRLAHARDAGDREAGYALHAERLRAGLPLEPDERHPIPEPGADPWELYFFTPQVGVQVIFRSRHMNLVDMTLVEPVVRPDGTGGFPIAWQRTPMRWVSSYTGLQQDLANAYQNFTSSMPYMGNPPAGDARRRDLERRAESDPAARRELAEVLLRSDPAAAEQFVTGSNDFALTLRWWQAMIQTGLADSREADTSGSSLVNYFSPHMIGDRRFLQWAHTEGFLLSISFGVPRDTMEPVTFHEWRNGAFGDSVTIRTAERSWPDSLAVWRAVAEVAEGWFNRGVEAVVASWVDRLDRCSTHRVLFSPRRWRGRPSGCTEACSVEQGPTNLSVGVVRAHGRPYSGSDWPTASVHVHTDWPGGLNPENHEFLVQEVARVVDWTQPGPQPNPRVLGGPRRDRGDRRLAELVARLRQLTPSQIAQLFDAVGASESDLSAGFSGSSYDEMAQVLSLYMGPADETRDNPPRLRFKLRETKDRYFHVAEAFLGLRKIGWVAAREGRRFWYVTKAHVLDDHRRQGLASKLYAMLGEEACKQGKTLLSESYQRGREATSVWQKLEGAGVAATAPSDGGLDPRRRDYLIPCPPGDVRQNSPRATKALRRVRRAVGKARVCYPAAEVVYHAAGGQRAGLTPMQQRHEGESHWWVRGPRGEVLDAAAAQFRTPVPYERGVGRGFLTKRPSRRARQLANVAGVKLNPTGCRIVNLEEEGDSELLGEARDLFDEAGIRPESVEDFYEACVAPDGRVLGASTLGLYTSDPDEGDPLQRPRWRFSVVVDEEARRQGIAKALVESITQAYPREAVLLEGKVVNPHMAVLLGKLGFQYEEEPDEEEWSDLDRRFGKRMYLPNPRRGLPVRANGDAGARDLERRWRSTRDPAAGEAYVRSLVRAGLHEEAYRAGLDVYGRRRFLVRAFNGRWGGTYDSRDEAEARARELTASDGSLWTAHETTHASVLRLYMDWAEARDAAGITPDTQGLGLWLYINVGPGLFWPRATEVYPALEGDLDAEDDRIETPGGWAMVVRFLIAGRARLGVSLLDLYGPEGAPTEHALTGHGHIAHPLRDGLPVDWYRVLVQAGAILRRKPNDRLAQIAVAEVFSDPLAIPPAWTRVAGELAQGWGGWPRP